MRALALLLAAFSLGVSVVEVGSGSVAGGFVFSGVGRVDLFYACGVGSVSNFGACQGDCLGFIAALEGDWRRLNVTIGGKPAEVLHAVEYRVSDAYRPRLYVVVFRGRGVGEVRVAGLETPEAYLLANFGVGKLQAYEIRLMPFVAGRERREPFNISLSLDGEFAACTVGKYAEAVISERGTAEASHGYYYGFFKGRGSRLTFHWEDVPQSAVKLMFVVATAPFLHVAEVVGADGAPVPADVLRALVRRGVVLGDGRVGFEDFGLLDAGGRQIRLEPNSTARLPGRSCVLTATTSLGTPIPLSVYYGDVLIARGVGSVKTYCIDGAYSVAYSWERSGPVSFSLSGRAAGNVTLPAAVTRFVVLNVFHIPVASVDAEVPAGMSVRLNLAGFVGDVMPEGPVVVASKYPLYTPAGVLALAALASAAVLRPFKRRAPRAYAVSLRLAVAFGLVDLISAVFWGSPPGALTGYALLALHLAYLALEVPWRLWQFAAAFAPAAAFYALFAASLLTAAEWWYLFYLPAAFGAFYYALKTARKWYCGECLKAYGHGAPYTYLNSYWSKALGDNVRRHEALEEEMGRLKGITDAEQRLSCLRAYVYREVSRVWNERCGYTVYEPICLYLEGVVDWRGYKALRSFMLGKGGSEECERAMRSLGLGQFSSLCKAP
ncbi:hypothetical protein [Pyrobaculum aerophilum]|uniref:hypothetical protein n=1 Tax=Pyrobaculum aerophilum TaxID=13773 RepID=UPI0023F50BCC|nr:hypothetical protein [Pyrobaculum aerophilum]MCX8136629.1 hypothetical protein [Pyrobaculum aerophilum]